MLLFLTAGKFAFLLYNCHTWSYILFVQSSYPGTDYPNFLTFQLLPAFDLNYQFLGLQTSLNFKSEDLDWNLGSNTY